MASSQNEFHGLGAGKYVHLYKVTKPCTFSSPGQQAKLLRDWHGHAVQYPPPASLNAHNHTRRQVSNSLPPPPHHLSSWLSTVLNPPGTPTSSDPWTDRQSQITYSAPPSEQTAQLVLPASSSSTLPRRPATLRPAPLSYAPKTPSRRARRRHVTAISSSSVLFVAESDISVGTTMSPTAGPTEPCEALCLGLPDPFIIPAQHCAPSKEELRADPGRDTMVYLEAPECETPGVPGKTHPRREDREGYESCATWRNYALRREVRDVLGREMEDRGEESEKVGRLRGILRGRCESEGWECDAIRCLRCKGMEEWAELRAMYEM